MEWDEVEVRIVFQLKALADVDASLYHAYTELESQGEGIKNKMAHLHFVPHPRVNYQNFDFQEELKQIPFMLNLGEAPLDKQQSRFIDILYILIKRSSHCMMCTLATVIGSVTQYWLWQMTC